MLQLVQVKRCWIEYSAAAAAHVANAALMSLLLLPLVRYSECTVPHIYAPQIHFESCCLQTFLIWLSILNSILCIFETKLEPYTIPMLFNVLLSHAYNFKVKTIYVLTSWFCLCYVLTVTRRLKGAHCCDWKWWLGWYIGVIYEYRYWGFSSVTGLYPRQRRQKVWTNVFCWHSWDFSLKVLHNRHQAVLDLMGWGVEALSALINSWF